MQPTSYLVHGANALTGSLQPILTRGEFTYDKKALNIYTAIACATLRQLVEDSETIVAMANSREKTENIVREQAYDFIHVLLQADMELMIKSGMDYRMAHYLFSDLSNMDAMLSSETEFSPETLRHRISELQYTVCKEAENLDPSLGTIKRTVYVVGGAAVFVTNVTADAVLGGVASAISQLAGTSLVARGWKG